MSFDHLWFEHFLPKGSIHCKDESVNVCGEVGHGHTQLWPLLRKLDLNPDLNIKYMFVSDLLVGGLHKHNTTIHVKPTGLTCM